MKLIKDIIRNFLEDFYRIKAKDNLFFFDFEGNKIKFFLPLRRDWIQQQIIVKKTFYEIYFLEKIRIFVKENSVFLDIGANIGNHTIFFAKILGAKKIYAFEPQEDIFRILKKNLFLNKISDKVSLYNIALGSKKTFGRIKSIKKNNFGSFAIKEGLGGKIKIVPLDSFGIKEKIHLIKIDVEGFEKEVLKGARNTISKNKPFCWIEVQPENKGFVFSFFRLLNYKRIIDLGDKENFLFIP